MNIKNLIQIMTLTTFVSATSFASVEQSCPRVEGFYATWDFPAGGDLAVEDLATDKLTHIIVAFAYPESDGSLNTTEADRYIDDIIEHAHNNNTGVMISVGGAGVDFLSMDDSARAQLIVNLVNYAKLHNLDGIDVDWEDWSTYNQPNPVESSMLLNLVKDLRQALPEHMEVTVDVQAGGWSGINFHPDLDEYADIVRFMAYDYTGGWGGSPIKHHASWQDIKSGLINPSPASQSMISKYNVEQTSLGLPFYNKTFVNSTNGPTLTFTAKDIVNNLVKGLGVDYNLGQYSLDNHAFFWETPNLITTKSQFVANNGYPGVFIWELHQDSRDEHYSLLNAIAKVLPKCQPCEQPWESYPAVYNTGDVVSYAGQNWQVNGGPLHSVKPMTLGHAHRYTPLGVCKNYVVGQ